MNKRITIWATIVAVLLLVAIGGARIVRGMADSRGVTLTWDAYDMSADNNIHVTHLELWQMDTGNNPLSIVAPGIPPTDTTLHIEWPADGRTYRFAIIAVSPYMNSEYSNIVDVKMPLILKPFAIVNLRAVVEE